MFSCIFRASFFVFAITRNATKSVAFKTFQRFGYRLCYSGSEANTLINRLFSIHHAAATDPQSEVNT